VVVSEPHQGGSSLKGNPAIGVVFSDVGDGREVGSGANDTQSLHRDVAVNRRSRPKQVARVPPNLSGVGKGGFFGGKPGKKLRVRQKALSDCEVGGFAAKLVGLVTAGVKAG
jgi:hypothetical protein